VFFGFDGMLIIAASDDGWRILRRWRHVNSYTVGESSSADVTLTAPAATAGNSNTSRRYFALQNIGYRATAYITLLRGAQAPLGITATAAAAGVAESRPRFSN